IKEEPEDQEYFLSRSVSVSPQSIKEEPGVPKDAKTKSDPHFKSWNKILTVHQVTELVLVLQEDLKIGSVFSLTEDSKPPRPAPAHMEIQASCSTCQKVLLDGETVYQRKAHSDLFCSTSCLLRFHQLKSVKKTCHFCLREIVKLQSVLQAAVDDAGTKKDFCSQSCLSSFNYKRIMSTKPPVVPAGSRSQCSVCSRFCISKHEVIHQDVVQKVCSDPCYRRFCNINNLSVCENCGSRCSAPLSLKMEDGSKPLCGAECLKLLKQKIQPLQPCSMCCKSKLVSEMFENKTSEEVVELFCSSSCVTAAKIQAVCSSGFLKASRMNLSSHRTILNEKIRRFVTKQLSQNFKNINFLHPAGLFQLFDFKPAGLFQLFDFKPAGLFQLFDFKPAGLFQETHRDKLSRTGGAEPVGAAPQRRPCAQCQEAIKAAPRVIQRKDEVTFVCSLVCSKKFKKLNGILGVCERCRKKTVIHEVKRIDNKDCSFCSDGCLLLFHRDLDRKWGKHCSSCSYCLSVSRTVLSGPAGGRRREFCSEGCRSKYRTLISHEANCDTCGRRGKLAESLPLPGNVKYFCDLKCLLRFGKNEEAGKHQIYFLFPGSPPPEPAGSVASSPVITSVVSLSGGPAGQTAPLALTLRSASAGLFSDIQAKVVGHASIQTAPRQLKNKSMLCVPLVHNKGASCCVQTVETASQTGKVRQVSSAVPVPVPVFVPLPMNLYSQLTPAPLVLPVPLPVPVFLRQTEEEKETQSLIGRKSVWFVLRKLFHHRIYKYTVAKKCCINRDESKTIDSYMDGLGSDYQPSFNHKDFESDCSLELFSQNQTCCVPPPEPDQNLHTGPDLPPPPAGPAGPNLQNSLDPPPAAGLGNEPQENIQNNLKVRRTDSFLLLQAENEKLNLKVLDSRVGVDAWRKWIQWRESQTSLDLLPSMSISFLPCVKISIFAIFIIANITKFLMSSTKSVVFILKELTSVTKLAAGRSDILRCSSSELSDGLFLFIREAELPEEDSCPPDGLFFLCLSIQQYLFENRRAENIFTDQNYQKFSSELTRILKRSRPSMSVHRGVASRVEEEFLWECKQLGAYSPIVLLNTLLFFSCKYFGFTTVAQQRRLSFTNFTSCTRTDGETSVLRFYPPESRGDAETGSDGVPAKKRRLNENFLEMKENLQNPLRCPVRLYEFYLSKCSDSVRRRSDVFYLQPDRRCVPSSPLWFSLAPLDDATMEAAIVRWLTVRELTERDGGGA
uniref:TRASH domain-containing protein n=1 Tax=Poecilia formosa TaxID=48698 RepID=A0A096LPV7_POEFO